MSNKNSDKLSGQWVGHFAYGPKYGEQLEGEKVFFRLFLEDKGNGQFQGRCYETEGIGASEELSIINGFIDNNLISFTKEYPTDSVIDEGGNTFVNTSPSNQRLIYTGEFSSEKNMYIGMWEIWMNERSLGDGTLVDICTGSWQMTFDA